jgi:predicted phage tail protein
MRPKRTRGTNMKTVDYLNLLKKKIGKTSYYAVSKHLKANHNMGSEQTIAHYDKGVHALSDEMVIVFSKELDIAHGIIAADIQAERAKNPVTKKMWGQIARQLQGAALSCFMFALVAIPTDNVQAGAINHAQNKVDSLYIMRTNKGE